MGRPRHLTLLTLHRTRRPALALPSGTGGSAQEEGGQVPVDLGEGGGRGGAAFLDEPGGGDLRDPVGVDDAEGADGHDERAEVARVQRGPGREGGAERAVV